METRETRLQRLRARHWLERKAVRERQVPIDIAHRRERQQMRERHKRERDELAALEREIASRKGGNKK